jgi:DNA-binding response OmpR family regulator
MIEDDHRLATMVVQYLDQHALRVTVAGSGVAGIRALRAQRATNAAFDLVLLDLMLPDTDGFDLCRQIRAESSIPVIMLTARGDPTDRVVGLELGADDYLPKPFEPRELLARIRAVLRRQDRSNPGAVLRFENLEIDRDARRVRVDGQERTLTAYQFSLLVALAEHAGRVLSREQLLDLVKGGTWEAFDRSIDVHMARIRALIEVDPKHPRRIITVRGAGYLFAKNQDV